MRKITFLLVLVFFIQHVRSATITSSGLSTNWNSGSTWVGGVIPTLTDDVIIAAGHSVYNGSSAFCSNLVVSATATLTITSGTLSNRGDFTNNGTIAGAGVLRVLCVNATNTFTSTTAINAPFLTLRFTVSSGRTYVIAAGTVITKIRTINIDGQTAGGFVLNNGELNMVSSSPIISASTFVNGATGVFSTAYNFSLISGGAVDFSTSGNTCTYTGTTWSSVLSTTYQTLTLSSGTTSSIFTKTLAGAITVNTLFTINANVKLSCAGFNITCGGNWIHNGTTTATDLSNLGTITFSGTTPTVTRTGGTERLTDVQVSPATRLTLGSDFQCSNLTLNSGTFDLSNSNFTCHLTGNLIVNAGALIDAKSGKFRFIGAAAQTISGAGTPTFYDIVTRNAAGVSVAGNIMVTNLVTDSLGSFGTSGVGTIRLVANGASQYARIGPVVGSLTGTGWVVEAFVSPGQANWTWLSTPINGNLLSDWDNDPRFYMSGIGGNDGNAGSFYSVRIYNTSTNTYTNITTKNHVLVRGRGYRVYMSDNMTALTTPLIYNSIGTPNFSAVPTPTLAAGGAGNGYNLVGNPYACPIDFSTLAAANSNINSGGFLVLQDNGTYATSPNSGVISPNQGFMVCATVNGSTMTFSESCKNTSSQPNLIRLERPDNFLKIKISNNFNGLGSETSIAFKDGASDAYDNNYDLPYLSNIFDDADNIWTKSSSGEELILNQYGVNSENKIVPLFVKPGVVGNHSIYFSGVSSFTAYNCIWLEDLQTGARVDLAKKSSYDFFTSDINQESRFLVHFENNLDCSSLKGLLTNNDLNENTVVYNNGSGVMVQFGFNELTPVNISVYNALGQEVIQTVALNVSSELVPLPIPADNQIYFVTIRSGEKRITRRIVY